ncbi:MAG: hypothetical protein ABL908_07790, partial [Hyphomicrobium sp.]
ATDLLSPCRSPRWRQRAKLDRPQRPAVGEQPGYRSVVGEAPDPAGIAASRLRTRKSGDGIGARSFIGTQSRLMTLGLAIEQDR